MEVLGLFLCLMSAVACSHSPVRRISTYNGDPQFEIVEPLGRRVADDGQRRVPEEDVPEFKRPIRQAQDHALHRRRLPVGPPVLQKRTVSLRIPTEDEIPLPLRVKTDDEDTVIGLSDNSLRGINLPPPEDLRNPGRPLPPNGFQGTTRSGIFEVRPPAIRPPAPPVWGNSGGLPVRPPAPPPTPPTATYMPSVTAGRPAPPVPVTMPAPPPGEERKTNATGISCFQFDTIETFGAQLTLPEGFQAIPVFEDRPTVDPTTNPSCRMIPLEPTGSFQMLVSSYETCGVRSCRQSNGETWKCIVLRFPRLNGLKLPEDEIVELRCRPHERVASDRQLLSVATAKMN